MPDYSKVSFTNKFRYERQVVKGSSPFSMGAFGSATVTIPHNLGYMPYVKVWYTYASGKVYELFAGANSYDLDGNGAQVDNTWADSSNLYVSFFSFSGSTINGRVYYRIYAEPAV